MKLGAWLLTVLLVTVAQALLVESASLTEGTWREEQGQLIQIEENRLSVKLRGVPLQVVLEEIGRRTGVEMSIPGPLTTPISTEFRDLPLEEGLRRLLRGYGWMMLHASSASQGGSTLRRVIVISGMSGVRPKQSEGSPRTAPEQNLPRAVAALVDRDEVKASLDLYLHGSNTQRDAALQRLLDALNPEGIALLIDMLQAENVPPAAWEAALAPLSGLLTSLEQGLMLGILQDRTARETIVKTLESYAVYNTRGWDLSAITPLGEELKLR